MDAVCLCVAAAAEMQLIRFVRFRSQQNYCWRISRFIQMKRAIQTQQFDFICLDLFSFIIYHFCWSLGLPALKDSYSRLKRRPNTQTHGRKCA